MEEGKESGLSRSSGGGRWRGLIRTPLKLLKLENHVVEIERTRVICIVRNEHCTFMMSDRNLSTA